MNPLQAHLHIFQLEGYSPLRFFKWWLKHPFIFSTSSKKPLIYTFKVKLILFVTFTLYLFLVLLPPFPYNLFFVFVFAIEPVFLLMVSLAIIKPYEITRRQLTIWAVRRTIISHKSLTVIGITGSYGKTTTKDLLFEILKRYKTTLKTPESYNTIFGISKVIDFELTSKDKLFICEMGAYIRGEIRELTHMVPPHYALLTAIGSQHLERFKSIKNTTLAKFELVDSVPVENALVNLDNPLISKHIEQAKYFGIKTFSLSNSKADFYLTNYLLTPNGMSFTLKHFKQKYQFETHLFGTSNLQDLVGAISLALLLKVPAPVIKNAVASLRPSPHRLELSKIKRATLIDNAYSSNEQGVINIIADLSKLPGKKVIITPGIVELGAQSAAIHRRLGELIAPVFNTTILVGHSDRTKDLESGIKEKNRENKIQYLENNDLLWPEIDRLSETHDWILIENDLPDNF